MADVVIVSGPPGAGKSTVGRRLAVGFPRGVHLHTDDFWHAIVAGGIPPYDPASDGQNQVVVGVTATAAFGYAAGGFTTVVDGIVGPWMLDHYRRCAHAHTDVELHYVVLRPARATALARAQARTTPDALVDPGPIGALWDQFADLGDLEPHVLDSTDDDADTTLDTVRRELDAGRLRLRPV